MMTMSPLGRGDLGHHTRHQRVSSDSDWPGWHFAKWVEQCGTSSFHWYCLGGCCAQGTRFTIKGCRLPHTALGGQVGGYSFGQAGRQGKPGRTRAPVKVCQLPDCPGWAVLCPGRAVLGQMGGAMLDIMLPLVFTFAGRTLKVVTLPIKGCPLQHQTECSWLNV